MGEFAATYDESRVVSEAIDAATLGTAPWDVVPQVLGEAFPAALCALLNHNVAENTLNFQAVHNISPEYLQSYADHYALLNPWVAFWQGIESGTVMVAERDCPAHLYSDTEFYNDWLRPQKDAEASVGIKIYGSPQEVIHLPIHYPLSKSPKYEAAAAEVLKRVRNSLLRSIDFGRQIRKRTEDALAGAALVERARCAAFVIDRHRRVREANQQAVNMLSASAAVFVRHGTVCLGASRAHGQFRQSVSDLSIGTTTVSSRIYLRVGERQFQVLVAPLPVVASASPLPLLSSRPLVLVLVKDLDVGQRYLSELSPLAARFKLTRAELLLCERLSRGDSLAKAASVLGIRVHTARDRVKTIFHKTGTHRQGELVAMLANVALSQ